MKYKYYITALQNKPKREECEEIMYWDADNSRWLPSLQPFEYKGYIYRYVLKEKKDETN